MLKRMIAAGALGACLISGAALAQTVTAEEQKILDALEPQAREYVMSRMGPDQTVVGLIETTIYNRLQQQFADIESLTYMVEDEAWEVVVVTPEGARRAHRIDYSMLNQFFEQRS
jgi:hypothetical protein